MTSVAKHQRNNSGNHTIKWSGNTGDTMAFHRLDKYILTYPILTYPACPVAFAFNDKHTEGQRVDEHHKRSETTAKEKRQSYHSLERWSSLARSGRGVSRTNLYLLTNGDFELSSRP